MIDIRNINIKFDNKECIRNGEFKAYSHRITGIYGESGTGKSSLLYIVGMLSNQQYDYYYNNEHLKLNDKQKSEFRNKHISFITQNALLIDTITVEKNIEFYLSQSNSKYTVDSLLDMINLKDKKNSLPASLSGGERQRVAIVCAIAKDSDIILGDELTSALDKDNKEIIMALLRKCAELGKTVILVSHEKNIIEQCDRVYKLEHMELTLEKEDIEKQEEEYEITKKKLKHIHMFELLFRSNRKINRRRLIISFMVMFIIFLSASIYRGSFSDDGLTSYDLTDVEDTKIVVFSDESGFLHYTPLGLALRDSNEATGLMSDENLAKIKEVDKIKKIYDYYTLGFNGNAYGWLRTSLKVSRNGKEVERRESSDEYFINDHAYDDFTLLPTYPEEELYDKEEDGVYVSSFTAFVNNIEVGDTLEIGVPVPYAMLKSNTLQYRDEDNNGNKYYDVDFVCRFVTFKTTVKGIAEGNGYEAEQILIHYETIENMINEQVAKYKSGEYEINKESYPEYTVMDLQPYAQAVFVDKYENVLSVKNEINKISDKIYAYNEYNSVAELIEENNKIIQQSIIMGIIGMIIFLVGATLVEIFYIRKYKSTYMMMRLIGYPNRQKNIVYLCHALWQTLNVICFACVLYIVSSLPDILPALGILTDEQVMDYMTVDYNYIYAYCSFSRTHFIVFILALVLIIGGVNIAMKKYYDKQDIKQWIRG